MATKLTRLTHKIATQLEPSGRELYDLQFSLQADSPETFGYTLVELTVQVEIFRVVTPCNVAGYQRNTSTWKFTDT
jgi:hypothetical protein